MRILIAPDKFKHSLTADQAAHAIAQGARRALASLPHSLDLCPISDGGEGFVRALSRATPSTPRSSHVRGPLRHTVRADWALTPDSAILESAHAAGLHLVPTAQRNPAHTTTRGVGQLIRRALRARRPSIIIGLGGSATCDGAVGMAAALGARFFDAHNARIRHPTGADLARIARIDLSRLDPRLRRTTITAAADVDSPLFGPRGSARVFAPQKGAAPEQVEQLDSGLRNLARLLRESGVDANPDEPGAGAAGGLGFGLAAFCNARLTPGAALVLDAVNFRARAATADLVITGEGRLDASSLAGKAAISAARAARESGARAVVAIVGAVGPGADDGLTENGGPLDAIIPLSPNSDAPTDSITNAAALLDRAAATTITAHLRNNPTAPPPHQPP